MRLDHLLSELSARVKRPLLSVVVVAGVSIFDAV